MGESGKGQMTDIYDHCPVGSNAGARLDFARPDFGDMSLFGSPAKFLLASEVRLRLLIHGAARKE